MTKAATTRLSESTDTALTGLVSDCWIAHNQPERPLTFGAWVCDCFVCDIAVHAAMVNTPELRLVVKRAMGRNAITPDEYLNGGAQHSLEGPDDYVREVFVAS